MKRTSVSKKLGIVLGSALIGATSLPQQSFACGTEAYLGTVCAFGFNFCPRGFAEANGQLLPINQNQALFSLLGTTYGGDGRTNFGLPDLRGRSLVGAGQGPGLNPVFQGQMGGVQQLTLGAAQMPPHSHNATTTVTVTSQAKGVASPGNSDNPTGSSWAILPRQTQYSSTAPGTDMNPGAVSSTASATTTVGTAGSGASVDIRDPFTSVKFCIVTEGIFPSRN